MNIYPAIDIKDGHCVRLTQGKAHQKTVYYADPLEPAKLWREAGATWVHVVDLDGAFTGSPQNLTHLKKIASTGMHVQWGGGMRNLISIKAALMAGASRVVIGTRACEEPASLKTFIKEFGGDRIAVGIDAKDGKVATEGWVKTSKSTAITLAEKVSALGVETIIYTDISRDGMLTGPNFEAQQSLLQSVPANIIASGGVSTKADVDRFKQVAQHYSNLEGVIIGKALYEKQFLLSEVIDMPSSNDT